jgi:voltage-gated potassium channel
MAAEFIGQPVAFDALYDVITRARGIHLEPARVAPGSWLDTRRVGDIDFAGQHLLLFGVIRPHTSPAADGQPRYELRDAHFYFNPQAEFRLHAHDMLMLIGYEASLFQLKERIGQRRSPWRRGGPQR